MMLKIGVGSSDEADSADATERAFALAVEQLEGLPPRAVMVFCGVDVDTAEVLRGLASRLPGVPLVGGTTLAEISVSTGAAQGQVLLVLFAGETLEAAAGHFLVGDLGHPLDAGAVTPAARHAVEKARASLSGPARLCLAFGCSDLGVSELHEAMRQAIGPGVPVIGGGVLRQILPEHRGEAFSGELRMEPGAVFLLLTGDFQVTHAVAHGFEPVGEDHTITRVLKSGTLVEVDGLPAHDVYRNYFGVPGDDSAVFVHHPMLIDTPAGQLLRGAVGRGPLPGSLILAGEVAEGSRMRLCEFDREGLLAATDAAVGNALASWRGSPPAAALVFECVTRWFVLGTLAPRSLDRLRACLPATTAIAGAYMGGEFAPFVRGGPGQLHNCSIVVLLIGELPD